MFTIATSINHECTRNRGLDVFEFTFIRNIANLLFSIPLFLYSGRSLFTEITKDKVVPLAVRILAGNIAFASFTVAFKLLPLGIG